MWDPGSLFSSSSCHLSIIIAFDTLTLRGRDFSPLNLISGLCFKTNRILLGKYYKNSHLNSDIWIWEFEIQFVIKLCFLGKNVNIISIKSNRCLLLNIKRKVFVFFKFCHFSKDVFPYNNCIDLVINFWQIFSLKYYFLGKTGKIKPSSNVRSFPGFLSSNQVKYKMKNSSGSTMLPCYCKM